VDVDYVKTMGLRVIRGRDFLPNLHSDSGATIINQAMVKALNLGDPIGQRISNGYQSWEVIGVVDDFHFESMKHAIQPLGLMIERSSHAVAIKWIHGISPG